MDIECTIIMHKLVIVLDNDLEHTPKKDDHS